MPSLRLLGQVLLLCGVAVVPTLAPQIAKAPSPATYLGFDRNEYPGDEALPFLRETFSFTSYWLGAPAGEKRRTWQGKRALLASQGFGFLVLFNGRESRQLKSAFYARQMGFMDADSAANFARGEGFPDGTVIFLDIEEGGRLPNNYHEYVSAWGGTCWRLPVFVLACIAPRCPSMKVAALRSPPHKTFGRTSALARWSSGFITTRARLRPAAPFRKLLRLQPPAAFPRQPSGSTRSRRGARISLRAVRPTTHPMAIVMRPPTRKVAGSLTPTSPRRRNHPPAIKVCN